jgi:hypothetical protein
MTTPSRAIVQSAGDVLLLGAGHVQEEFHRAARCNSCSLLHASTDHADGADCRLQPASQRRPAVVPMASPQPRSSEINRAPNDAATDRRHRRIGSLDQPRIEAAHVRG